jgi:hypothetical protein
MHGATYNRINYSLPTHVNSTNCIVQRAVRRSAAATSPASRSRTGAPCSIPATRSPFTTQVCSMLHAECVSQRCCSNEVSPCSRVCFYTGRAFVSIVMLLKLCNRDLSERRNLSNMFACLFQITAPR